MRCRVVQPQQVGRRALVGHQRAQQVPEGEVWPQHGAEHEQGLAALPQEEVAEAALPRGADQQVHLGAALQAQASRYR